MPAGTCNCCGSYCIPCGGPIPDFLQIDDIGVYNCPGCSFSGAIIMPVQAIITGCTWRTGFICTNVRIGLSVSVGFPGRIEVNAQDLVTPWSVLYRGNFLSHPDWPNCKKMFDTGITIPWLTTSPLVCPPTPKPTSIFVHSV